MIDLHCHTELSDGKHRVAEVIEFANEANLEYFSITDHNHALAYVDEYRDVLASFRGNLIVGSEIATSYQGTIVELLCYGIDSQKINAWYQAFFAIDHLTKNETWLFEECKRICIEAGYEISSKLSMTEIKKGWSKKLVYEEFKKHPDNVNKSGLANYHDFFRMGLANPKHPLFLNEALTYPTMEEVIALAHDAGGLVFLAHPYEYQFACPTDVVIDIFGQFSLDGVECHHPTASKQQAEELVKICLDNHKYCSGGSDFHMHPRKVGVSSGGEGIPTDLVGAWMDKISYWR